MLYLVARAYQTLINACDPVLRPIHVCRYSGPWCFCKDPLPTEPKAQYCAPPLKVPEQINLQLAGPNVVVVGFVTYDSTNASTKPTAMCGNFEIGLNKSTVFFSPFFSPFSFLFLSSFSGRQCPHTPL